MEKLTKIAVFVCSLPLIILWQGYVLAIFYKWFVAFGELGAARAAGLLLTVRFVKGLGKKEPEGGNLEDLIVDLVFSVLTPAVVLFVGWVLKLCMDNGW